LKKLTGYTPVARPLATACPIEQRPRRCSEPRSHGTICVITHTAPRVTLDVDARDARVTGTEPHQLHSSRHGQSGRMDRTDARTDERTDNVKSRGGGLLIWGIADHLLAGFGGLWLPGCDRSRAGGAGWQNVQASKQTIHFGTEKWCRQSDFHTDAQMIKLKTLSKKDQTENTK